MEKIELSAPFFEDDCYFQLMNVFAQVSYVEFEYYQFCVFKMIPNYASYDMKKKRMQCILVLLIERNEK